MAVRVMWDDESEKVFDDASAVEKEYDRSAPFVLVDDDDKTVAMVPDFGVRIVELL